MSDSRTIPTIEPTGKERWNRLVVLERIRCEMRSIVLAVTIDARANIPDHYHWARDLRRGRTNVYGGLFRLFDVMQRRGMGHIGRTYALRLLELAHEYVDLVLPESPPTPPAVEPLPDPRPRMWHPVRAMGAAVIRRTA